MYFISTVNYFLIISKQNELACIYMRTWVNANTRLFFVLLSSVYMYFISTVNYFLIISKQNELACIYMRTWVNANTRLFFVLLSSVYQSVNRIPYLTVTCSCTNEQLHTISGESVHMRQSLGYSHAQSADVDVDSDQIKTSASVCVYLGV